jgi:hypothetical protein
LDFGFWILDWLGNHRTELEIRQNFLMIPLERGGLKPLFFGQEKGVVGAGLSDLLVRRQNIRLNSPVQESEGSIRDGSFEGRWLDRGLLTVKTYQFTSQLLHIPATEGEGH